MKFIDQTICFPPCPDRRQSSVQKQNVRDTSFLFVNSRRGQIPKQIRQPMRSHVMQHARSKRKWSTSKGIVNDENTSRSSSEDAFDSPLQSPASEASQHLVCTSRPTEATFSFNGSGAAYWPPTELASPGCDSPHCTSFSKCSSCVSRQGIDYFGPLTADWAYLDPYASLPVQLNSFARGMLDRYLCSLNHCFTINGRIQSSISHAWFAAAFASRAFMYSLLCAAATHLYALGQSSYYAVLEYKSNAITELNTTLSDPVLGTTDGNIGAVFNLLCVDETFPLPIFEKDPNHNPDGIFQRRVHLQGLKRMIQVRGGLTALRSNPCLYSFLLWHTTAHSVASFQQSEFSPEPELLDSVLGGTSQTPGTDTSSNRMILLLRSSKSPEVIVTAAQHVTAFTRQFNAWLNHDNNAPDFMELGNFSGLIIQNLLHFLNTRTIDSSNPMAEAMAIALIMYTVRATNDATPPFDALHYAATRWLRLAMLKTPGAEWDPDLRLWICTIAAVCAQGSREASEIENEFVKACIAWEVGTYQELIETMEGLLWVNSRYDDGVKSIWERLKRRIIE